MRRTGANISVQVQVYREFGTAPLRASETNLRSSPVPHFIKTELDSQSESKADDNQRDTADFWNNHHSQHQHRRVMRAIKEEENCVERAQKSLLGVEVP
jgi:hypothetical protein